MTCEIMRWHGHDGHLKQEGECNQIRNGNSGGLELGDSNEFCSTLNNASATRGLCGTDALAGEMAAITPPVRVAHATLLPPSTYLVTPSSEKGSLSLSHVDHSLCVCIDKIEFQLTKKCDFHDNAGACVVSIGAASPATGTGIAVTSDVILLGVLTAVNTQQQQPSARSLLRQRNVNGNRGRGRGRGGSGGGGDGMADTVKPTRTACRYFPTNIRHANFLTFIATSLIVSAGFVATQTPDIPGTEKWRVCIAYDTFNGNHCRMYAHTGTSVYIFVTLEYHFVYIYILEGDKLSQLCNPRPPLFFC